MEEFPAHFVPSCRQVSGRPSRLTPSIQGPCWWPIPSQRYALWTGTSWAPSASHRGGRVACIRTCEKHFEAWRAQRPVSWWLGSACSLRPGPGELPRWPPPNLSGRFGCLARFHIELRAQESPWLCSILFCNSFSGLQHLHCLFGHVPFCVFLFLHLRNTSFIFYVLRIGSFIEE